MASLFIEPMHYIPLRHMAGLYTLCTASFVFAQTPATIPSGNPLDTLPQPQLQPPAPPASSSLPSQNQRLEMTQGLQPRLQLSTQVAVTHIDIAGVRALPFEQIAQLFQPLAGKVVTIEQLALAAQQATQAYQKAGYALSFVYLPEQNFAQGIVKVMAVEGHTNTIQIEGDVGKSGHLLAEVAQPILDSNPLQGEVFTKQTLLMARMLNMQVTAQAAMPTTTDGATPLVLKVKRDPVAFGLTGDFQQDDPKAIANLTLNDPLWGGSQWRFSGLLKDPKEERFANVTWNQWLNAQGTTLRMSYSDFKGQDEKQLSYLDSTTSQKKLELNISHPWLLDTQGSTVLGASVFGLDYSKDYQYQFIDGNLALQDQEKVRALQAQVLWQKNHQRAAQSANLTLTHGLDAWGAGSTRTPGLLANPAKFDFVRLALDYSLRWRFQNMVGMGLSAGGQYSPDTLPVSERISFGGWRFGRGYRAGEAAGDQGLGISAEINKYFPVTSMRWVKNWEPYVLYEEAQTWFHTEGWADQRLRSASIGLRFGDQRYYALDLSVSKPMGDKSYYNPEDKVRYNMTLTYQLDL